METKEEINLEDFLEETEEAHSDFDKFPGPLEMVGHELGNWAQKSYLDGPEVAREYNRCKEMLENKEEGRDEVISEIRDIENQYSEIIATGLEALEGYIDILRADEPGAIALGDFLDEMCYQNNVEVEYDRDQTVSGNEALFIPFCTMIKNSHQYFEGDTDDLEISIEAEDTQDGYTLTYTDNGPSISEEVQKGMYEGSEEKIPTGLPTAAEIVEWAGGEMEYHEEDGRYGHQVTLPKA